MKRRSDAERTGADVIYREIGVYCDDRINGIGGSHVQVSYKRDFFQIFIDAYRKGLCGNVGRSKLLHRHRKLKRKRLNSADYLISGQSIRESLEEWTLNQPKTDRVERMINDLTEWWDERTFAWDHFPLHLLPLNWLRTHWEVPRPVILKETGQMAWKSDTTRENFERESRQERSFGDERKS